MSLTRTFFTSCVVLGALGAAGYFIVAASNAPAPRSLGGEQAMKVLPGAVSSEDCLSDDCWIYRDSRLHCATPEDAQRFQGGDVEGVRCRAVSYICVVSDCAPEHEIRSRDSFVDTIEAIGDRTWRQWTLRHQDHKGKGARFRLTLDEDGNLAKTDTLMPSGSSSFDEAAIAAIRTTAPFTELEALEPEVRVLMRQIVLTFGQPLGPWRDENNGSRKQ